MLLEVLPAHLRKSKSESAQVFQELLENKAFQETSVQTGTIYSFPFSMYRQVAYEGLPHALRRNVHKHIAEVTKSSIICSLFLLVLQYLEKQYSEIEKRQQASVIAMHFKRAEMWDKADEYLTRLQSFYRVRRRDSLLCIRLLLILNVDDEHEWSTCVYVRKRMTLKLCLQF